MAQKSAQSGLECKMPLLALYFRRLPIFTQERQPNVPPRAFQWMNSFAAQRRQSRYGITRYYWLLLDIRIRS